MIGTRAPLDRAVRSPALLVAALAGVVVAALVMAGASGLAPAETLRMPPAGPAVLIASGVAVALAVLLAPSRLERWRRAAIGLAGLGGQALLVAVADPLALAVVLLLVAFGAVLAAARGPWGLRIRGPALAAVLLGVGWTLVRTPGTGWLGRVGALALALALVAAAGLLPYLADLDAEEPAGSSLVAWTGFFGPALALTLPGKVLASLTAVEAGVFGATLVAMGLVNLGWGVIAAWRSASDAEAWRGSFLADWGLALVGLGLLGTEGQAAAYLVLLGVLVVRVPLHLAAVVRGSSARRGGLLVVLIGVLLCGAAPFSGFPPRVLVLQAATMSTWPLALVVLVALLAWIAHAFRLARTVDQPRGLAALGLGLVVVASLVLGLAPAALRSVGGL